MMKRWFRNILKKLGFVTVQEHSEAMSRVWIALNNKFKEYDGLLQDVPAINLEQIKKDIQRNALNIEDIFQEKKDINAAREAIDSFTKNIHIAAQFNPPDSQGSWMLLALKTKEGDEDYVRLVDLSQTDVKQLLHFLASMENSIVFTSNAPEEIQAVFNTIDNEEQ